jgi:hypothetical protein
MVSVTWAEVRARRLARSSLVDRARADRLVDVTRELGGVHAQVQVSAELQLAGRIDGIVQDDVREALWERRLLVKAWTLRGTLHLHPADELALWFAARRAVLGAVAGSDELPGWTDPAGVLHPALGAAEVAATRAAVWDVLDGRVALLREELADEVTSRVGPGPRERLRSGFAFFLGELCQGPPQGAKITLVRPDRWIEGWQEVDEPDALREVCRRFLRTYGPSRPAEFREWFSSPAFTPGAARGLFESLGDELEEIDVEGRGAFVLAGDTSFRGAPPSVRLLSEYDAHVMGFRERERLIPDPVREQVAAHGRGRYEGPAGVRFLMVDGVAAGIWDRKKHPKRVELRVRPVRKLARGQRAELDAEAERIGAFLGLEPILTVD